MFNTKNSGRAVVGGSAEWKSRKLDLGNRHRTTGNFGDLIPAYWQHVQPGDKLRMDATILAKFLPLIAPAFTRMKIKSEWFYVPLRQIAPPTLRMLQDFKPDVEDMQSYFTSILNGSPVVSAAGVSDNQQVNELKGTFSIPASYINAYLCGETVSRVDSNSNEFFLGSDFSCDTWRTPDVVLDVSSSRKVAETLGQEVAVSFTSKFRNAKLMSYMGLPSRLTTMRYFGDVSTFMGAESAGFSVDSYSTDLLSNQLLTARYRELVASPSDGSSECFLNALAYTLSADSAVSPVGAALSFPLFSSFNTSTNKLSFSGMLLDYFAMPYLTTYSTQSISMLPFQAYQKIYNDFYRDEKLQTDEIRYYPYAIWDNYKVTDALEHTTLFDFASAEYVHNLWINSFSSSVADDNTHVYSRLFNNLFGLRRRNRAKDVMSSCVTSQVVKGQLNVSTNETVYDAKLQSRLARFFMKKEFTGSTWAEWLNNFFGVNSNDLLNNNVVFLGGRESVVSISENIQNSSSTDDSAQGNRAGLANDFHNGSEIYFRVPDFGIVMCIVSILPDDIDNFNGLQERFIKSSVFDFNLPDFQNIGFSAVKNSRNNIGIIDSSNLSSVFPSWSSSLLGDRQHADSAAVFGFQPFGYSHTYTPNIISGDFQNSLRYWHQSPDLDTDFSKRYEDSDTHFSQVNYFSWVDNQLQLNWNLPCIGLRSQPYGSDLKSQYYNNVFAVTNDESGDHIVMDMRFAVSCHRDTAFFTEAVANN